MAANRYVHPFPARMAPDIALAKLVDAPMGSTVLDPMVGSGTVLRTASELGHHAIGCDLDPLAILLSRVGSRRIDPCLLYDCANSVLRMATGYRGKHVPLPWIDGCPQTQQYIEYWFAKDQRQDLRVLSRLLVCEGAKSPVWDALKVALSRIVVTKTSGASLAWDVSHSRPHKVRVTNDFDVMEGFRVACEEIALYMLERPKGLISPKVRRDDARLLHTVPRSGVDVIVTSPPYLNAIDYMRGHRMALVWLGYQIPSLRSIRKGTIGSESAPEETQLSRGVLQVVEALGKVRLLPNKWQGVARRYSVDLVSTMKACSRVLKNGGAMHLVIGDSRLRGVKLANSSAAILAAELAGFALVDRRVRRIPAGNRYLPAGRGQSAQLAKRMLTEHVISLEKVQ